MTDTSITLRSDLEAIAAGINVGGAAYEIWARRFSEECDRYMAGLESHQRDAAIQIARDLGYYDANEEPEFDPSVCWRSGIDNAYCHCGHHE